MSFNVHEFVKQRYIDRIEFVAIPELEKYFAFDEADEKQIGVKVRGLTGNEYARCISESRKEIARVAMELLSASGGAIAKAVQELLGVGDSPQMIEQRVAMMEFGLVWPEIKDDMRMAFAAKLNKILPLDFLKVTNKIIELTGQGQCPDL